MNNRNYGYKIGINITPFGQLEGRSISDYRNDLINYFYNHEFEMEAELDVNIIASAIENGINPFDCYALELTREQFEANLADIVDELRLLSEMSDYFYVTLETYGELSSDYQRYYYYKGQEYIAEKKIIFGDFNII